MEKNKEKNTKNKPNMKKSKKKKRGFTLIELLAVIVILGLLMAIAIPSVTRYITQSRKKTVVSSIDSYISSAVNSLNNQDFKFTAPNTIYAIPIECIPLEKGGTNPFGEWMQASNDYWAYVLVQYDSENLSYNYGFTFKDSAGYGMYPTIQSEINPKSSGQIKTGLQLSTPISGKVTNITVVSNWIGFKVDKETNLIVLEAESEGKIGDGEKTCTLCQKGRNYQDLENEKNKRLINRIKKDNPIIEENPTLTTTSSEAGDTSGLYISTATNSGEPTYYFRGSVNNYVEFAGIIWRIIRINEDNTIRLILNGNIGNISHIFNSSSGNETYMYYSNNSNAKTQVDNWYKTNITDKGFDSYVAEGMFCEEAKLKERQEWTGGNANLELYSTYNPDFKCSTDANGKGKMNSKVGLITYDELMYAGLYFRTNNISNYLCYGGGFNWTMSPAGYETPNAVIWLFNGQDGSIDDHLTSRSYNLRPVINIKSNLLSEGSGTKNDPYVVVTK